MPSTAWCGHPALVNGDVAAAQALIQKIYVILRLQLLLSAVVAAVVVKVRAIPHFFVPSNAGLGLYIFIIIFPFIVICPLYLYRQKDPVNLLLLGIFTVSISFAVVMTFAFTTAFCLRVDWVQKYMCRQFAMPNANGTHSSCQAAQVTIVDAFSQSVMRAKL